MRGNTNQLILIFAGLAVVGLTSLFFYRELFPEYKIYQHDYVELEKFRSTYTGEQPPPFKYGIKQIVIEQEDRGPPVVDRCTSCHLAVEFEHFSPTKIKYNVEGFPELVPNENDVWARLNEKIQELERSGDNPRLLETYRKLKKVKVGEREYDVEKVLRMHPLIGRETRPFEYHPLNEYGCTSCHNGNGRGLVTDRAHGPVFDGDYEKEFQGHVPEFLEKEDNSLPFSRAYNGKPGHRLLFQTNPLFVGSLMQAKCMQCHSNLQEAGEIGKTSFKLQADIDKFTKNYQRGEQLYLSQACYACHRIQGLSKGGVGPELTETGLNYPWFIKESIVWPQADLKTSTMPNYRLDHEELEDLVTFLLGQTGQRKTHSEIDKKQGDKEWETGQRKMPWEKPATPKEIYDLRYSMTVFATEGCASCHRLKGFTSNVGFEKEKHNPTFEDLYKEKEWFKSIISENITGSELVKAMDAHSDTIDQKIVDGVREGAILEEIESKFPGLVASFYAPFKYAERAREDSKWQPRVHRVLMLYVQEYGLGRLIGPRPNWSGIYRTDQWLMEHFRNPISKLPQSIMPIMPFDDTKFYALTYMLDILGKENRDAVRAIWEHRGFNPKLAYDIHCAQCHGEYMQGNGPVAEWIYPIPKNLRRADFLRNLTRERAAFSIMHGVNGTPMPPWGEVADDKKAPSFQPVLSKEEVDQLVDWMFSSLPGGTVIREEKDVPKWKYQPEDILKELKREGNVLEKKEAKATFFQQKPERYFAGLLPNPNDGHLKVNEVFERLPNPIPGPDENLYFIKQTYYTPENIEEGQRFFWTNCAVCHGKEADGKGLRAETMQEAKPRMLINLNWLSEKDDLRLIRSIKYGVPSTAMTPWGDQTTSLQRLQLVIYIRTLIEEHELRNRLNSLLYQAFDATWLNLEKVREKDYTQIENLKEQSKPLEQESEDALLESFRFEKERKSKLAALQEKDRLLIDLEESLKQEKEIVQKLALRLISQNTLQAPLESLFEIIALKNGSDRAETEKLEKKIIQEIEEAVGKLKEKQKLMEGAIISGPILEQQKEIKNAITTLQTLLKEAHQTFSEMQQLEDEQRNLLKTFHTEFSGDT